MLISSRLGKTIPPSFAKLEDISSQVFRLLIIKRFYGHARFVKRSTNEVNVRENCPGEGRFARGG